MPSATKGLRYQVSQTIHDMNEKFRVCAKVVYVVLKANIFRYIYLGYTCVSRGMWKRECRRKGGDADETGRNGMRWERMRGRDV